MSKVQLRKPLGIAIAAAMALGTQYATAGKYLTDSIPTVTVTGYGECWQTVEGMEMMVEKCGDVVAAPAAAAPVDKDSDGDGVLDKNDKCPGTRAGAKVDADGCEIFTGATINTTADHFDFDSAVLKPAMKSALDDVAAKVNATPSDEQLEVVGHTDSTGPEAYNQGLSERRAQAAADYLTGKGATVVSVSGMGETQPVADNATREGRAANRRVEIRSK